MSVASELKT